MGSHGVKFRLACGCAVTGHSVKQCPLHANAPKLLIASIAMERAIEGCGWSGDYLPPGIEKALKPLTDAIAACESTDKGTQK